MIKYERSKGLTEARTHYCPGCTHGILHKQLFRRIGVLGKPLVLFSWLLIILHTLSTNTWCDADTQYDRVIIGDGDPDWCGRKDNQLK